MKHMLCSKRVFALFGVLLLLQLSACVAPAPALRSTPLAPECVSACQELYDDCASTDTASTLLLIPAYVIAITAGLLLSAGGGGSCGGIGDGVSCRDTRKECLRSCPLDYAGGQR